MLRVIAGALRAFYYVLRTFYYLVVAVIVGYVLWAYVLPGLTRDPGPCDDPEFAAVADPWDCTGDDQPLP